MTEPTQEEKRRLCEAHGVDEYQDLPAVVRNNVEAENTVLTEASYTPADGLAGFPR